VDADAGGFEFFPGIDALGFEPGAVHGGVVLEWPGGFGPLIGTLDPGGWWLAEEGGEPGGEGGDVSDEEDSDG
jgi:hypothetical protein